MSLLPPNVPAFAATPGETTPPVVAGVIYPGLEWRKVAFGKLSFWVPKK